MRKTTFIAGFAVGYVLGARAGRARYEQIRALTRKVMDSPTVQSAKSQVQANASDALHTATDKASDSIADKWADVKPGWLPGGRSKSPQPAGSTNGHPGGTGWAAGSSGQIG
jgi:hypothetical protein